MDILRRAGLVGDHQIWHGIEYLVFWLEANNGDL